jgi:hypothetical protein
MSRLEKSSLTVTPDPEDLRDRVYRPSLQPLAPVFDPEGFYAADCGEAGPCYVIRDQGSEGTCTGQALAHLIDMNRYQSAVRRLGPQPTPDAIRAMALPPSVSARMLYEMARRTDASPAGDEGSSLRAVIKGFYHYGVCPEQNSPHDPKWQSVPPQDGWPYRAGDTDRTLTVDRAISARSVTLGAYYRVQPYLNDYHAAVQEAGAILVSAQIHAGWDEKKVRRSKGVIVPEGEDSGGHAFVIVGYNEQGFLVLNSWGSAWGGCHDSRGVPLRGIALWSYQDWSARVMDAWVLRLGVRAPQSFDSSVGAKGIFFDLAAVRAGSSACHNLLGHFAHLDDGFHVEQGSYASSLQSAEKTVERLRSRANAAQASGAADRPRPVVLSIPGSLLPIKEAFEAEVQRRPVIEGTGTKPALYPYTLFWCNDVVESSTEVLTRIFEEAQKKSGPGGKTLDRTIEAMTHGIGRAFWRDIKLAADTATRRDITLAERIERQKPAVAQDPPRGEPRGDAAHLIDGLASIPRIDIHLVVEGAGAILMGRYLHWLEARPAHAPLMDRFLDCVASLTLIAPTLEYDDFARDYRRLIGHLGRRDGQPRAVLWVPSKSAEARLHVGPYGKSILDLVLYGFEGAAPERRFIGMSRDRSGIMDRLKADADLAGLAVRDIPLAARSGLHRLDQHDLMLGPALQKAVLAHLVATQGKS